MQLQRKDGAFGAATICHTSLKGAPDNFAVLPLASAGKNPGYDFRRLYATPFKPCPYHCRFMQRRSFSEVP